MELFFFLKFSKKPEFYSKTITVFLALLALSLAGYALSQNIFFAVGVFFFLIVVFVVDFMQAKTGKNERVGWKQTVFEVLTAFGLAVVAWLVLSLVLQTSTPLNVVTSCSMLPVLERGDLIVLQGGPVRVPEVSVPFALSNASSQVRQLSAVELGKTYALVYTTIVSGVDVVNYSFTDCVVKARGESSRALGREACVESAFAGGKVFQQDSSNDVIVYDAVPAKYGLIIHRAFARLNATDGVFYLTKGDNNLFVDQQAGISLVPENKVRGKVLFRIPLVGYLKLFLFLQFEEPPGCRQTLEKK